MVNPLRCLLWLRRLAPPSQTIHSAGNVRLAINGVVVMSPTGPAPNDAAGEIVATCASTRRRTRPAGGARQRGVQGQLPPGSRSAPTRPSTRGSPGIIFRRLRPSPRSEKRGDYARPPSGDRRKRADYFAAVPLVVWTLTFSLESSGLPWRSIRTGRAFPPRDTAEAEPSVP